MAQTRETTIKELTPDKRNANRGTQRGAAALENSLRQYGAGRSILIDAKGQVIAGNKTLEQAASIGLEDVIIVPTDGKKIVAVQRTDLDLDTDPMAMELAIADNRVSEIDLSWNPEALKAIGAEIDLTKFWSQDELKDLLGPDEAAAEAAERAEATPNVPENPLTKPGDLIILGNHRLLCGDSRDVAQVARLLGDVRPDLAFQDPPYGIEIVSRDLAVGNRIPVGPALSKGVAPGKPVTADRKSGVVGGDPAFKSKTVTVGSAAGKVGTIHRGMKAKPIVPANVYPEIIGDDSPATAITAYEICSALKIPVMIFWGANHYSSALVRDPETQQERTWALPASSCWIVWDKDNGESFFADAELAWTNQKTAVRLFKHKWNGLIKDSERGEKRCHPTQKPVALASWCIEHYGQKARTVLDLFCGSGSCLMACELAKRACFAMELSPAYCDVIVMRWEQFTGQGAKRLPQENES